MLSRSDFSHINLFRLFRNAILFSAMAMLVSACGNKPLFEQNTEIKTRQWDLNEPVVFKVNVDDTLSRFNVYINLRNTGQYRYSNLYLFLTTQYPDKRIEKDTLDITLAEDDGRWKGNGLGDLFFNQFLFASNVSFISKGEYTFTVQQGMRTNPLPGIADVGLRIEKAEKK